MKHKFVLKVIKLLMQWRRNFEHVLCYCLPIFKDYLTNFVSKGLSICLII